MGKPTGFIEIARQTSLELPPEERIRNFNEFHVPLHTDEQQTQGARCMDCGVPFCQSGVQLGGMFSGCPLNNLIPEWNDLVYQGKWDLAVHRLIATNRYPEFTSRVCPALCEAACTCGHVTGSAVTVKENERAIVEYGYESGAIHAVPPPARTGKTVAVIGAGPAGLSVADLLNKRGHKVTIYEREDRPGGLLMYGIPNMKLEKWVIDRRIRILQDEGIFNTILSWFGIGPVSMIHTIFAVILGMVYNFIPFMILQIHTSLAKMDKSLLEAANDLGATPVQAFLRVTLPLSLPGVISGITLVFLPAVSSFFIPKLLGGGQFVLVGNIIESQFLTSGDWNFGSAISLIMAIIIMLSMWLTRKVDVQPASRGKE